VADGEKARRELGFVPRFSSRDALTSFLEYRYPEAAQRARRPAAEAQEAQW
jgi:nucleoside-diphosphate-sugar epimerase